MSNVRLPILFAWASLCLLGTSPAQTKPIQNLQAKAKSGDADAELSLGNMYMAGQGVKVNPRVAMKWYLKAAEQGNSEAEGMVANYYEDGIPNILPVNLAESLKWEQKLANQGFAKAQEEVGAAYASGRGTKRDDIEAARWMRKAADQGEPFAQYALGSMYEDGNGVPENKNEAAFWYQKAALQNQDLAQYHLGFLYLMGKGVDKDYDEAYFWINLSAASYAEARPLRDQVANSLEPLERDVIENRCLKWFEIHPLPRDVLQKWLESQKVNHQ